jgi:coenzyme PQQ precursor peptide PqqA
MVPGNSPNKPAGKEVTAMARKTVVPRPKRCAWKPPAFEEITVSAEATMYMGAWKDQDWV